MSPVSAIVSLPPEQLDDVVDVYAEAFHGYPLTRFTVGTEGDVDARERRLVRLFVTRGVRRGGSMYGIRRTGPDALAGAVLLTMLPRAPQAPPEVAEVTEAAWQELGDDARRRYDVYAAASDDFFRDAGRHLHLNMIGVRRADKGRGVGRRLLEFVRELAERDPNSPGVSLTTENPRNVDLYRHFGYEVVGHAPIAPGLETWGMFLRIR